MNLKLEKSTLVRFPSVDHPASDSSPASQKKGGVSSSVMDRLRSPGTVRKLSLKMKKLPELRRKLSLRSSSRASRQEEASAKTSASSSSQNIISRYHLDSSAPPARLSRRSSRGSSASKAGRRSSRTASPDAGKPSASPHGWFPLQVTSAMETLLSCSLDSSSLPPPPPRRKLHVTSAPSSCTLARRRSGAASG